MLLPLKYVEHLKTNTHIWLDSFRLNQINYLKITCNVNSS
jgi:hypothetical protein